MQEQQPGNQGQRLIGHLRGLFGGNHCTTSDVQTVSEECDIYPVSAFVSWQFRHTVSTQTHKGNAAIKGGHFDYRMNDFQNHLRHLFEQAARNREIRGPFMQRVDVANAKALDWSTTPQAVHDFGAYSVCRQCDTCSGRGRVRCGGCGGGGKRTCSGCGGAGARNRTETRTRWNGHHHVTHTEHIRETCHSCNGRGRVVCTSCGGSGHQKCGSCSGHGFFTDVSHVQAIAHPSWRVPVPRGLASEALASALTQRGPSGALALVALALRHTGYNEQDHWVVEYAGAADVVALKLNVVKQPYYVAAAGSVPTPIITPPVFDQLLAPEVAKVAAIAVGKRANAQVKRQAKMLFTAFRGLPILDASLRAIAKLDRKTQVEPSVAIRTVTEGFISHSTAETLGNAALSVLDKVSPANSKFAWCIVALVPASMSFVHAASSFNSFSPQSPWSALLPFVFTLIGAVLAMLIASPAGWILSTLVSYLWRLRVPREYRQRGRNWAPLKQACSFAIAMALCGTLAGIGGAIGWWPTVTQAESAATDFAIRHTPQGSSANQYLVNLESAHTEPKVDTSASGEGALREVQRILIEKKYLRGVADGQPGPRTNAAISAYKRHEHLPASLPIEELLVQMQQMSR